MPSNQLPLEDRQEFWKFSFAQASFDEATKVAEVLLSGEVPLGHPLHYALTNALIVLYGRPFKQRPVVRLPEDVVPPNKKYIHDTLITTRDKMFAHADIDVADDLNKVIVTYVEGCLAPGLGISVGSLRRETLEGVRDLASTLSGKMDYHIEKIWSRLRTSGLVNGEYEVNVSEGSDVFLIPARGLDG